MPSEQEASLANIATTASVRGDLHRIIPLRSLATIRIVGKKRPHGRTPVSLPDRPRRSRARQAFARSLLLTSVFSLFACARVPTDLEARAEYGRPAHSADFGQTLGVWGIGPGPAVQLPHSTITQRCA